MPDQQKLTTRKEEDEKRPEEKAPSTYPITPDKQKVFELGGILYTDNEIGRAWCRLYDKGQNFGQALAASFVNKGHEFMYFAYGYADRDQSGQNINKTVRFYHQNELAGEESGL